MPIFEASQLGSSSVRIICFFTGFSARQRKVEVEKLNEQLRKINVSLRQQAKAGTIYAPGLNYAPPPTFKRSEGGTFTVIEPEQVSAPKKVAHHQQQPVLAMLRFCQAWKLCVWTSMSRYRLLKNQDMGGHDLHGGGVSQRDTLDECLLLSRSPQGGCRPFWAA